MKGIKFSLVIFTILCAALVVYFVLQDEKALLTHPKGIIAHEELSLIGINYLLMLIVVLPTIIALFVIAWKYCAKNTKNAHDPEHSATASQALILWAFPSAIIGILSVILWNAAHDLDPYKPLKSEKEPLVIQVVALDWKWLFIYPEQGIATLGYFQIPEKIPVHFDLTADGSPMNSFWIPQLSGQIYAMAGMQTQIHMMADGPGDYMGRAAEINGAGYADMTFKVKSTTEEEFESWVQEVKASPHQLTSTTYNALVPPSRNNPVLFYSHVEKNLFHDIMKKHMASP
jgi:cytochrome o ubiquinol oxidase subunit 2